MGASGDAGDTGRNRVTADVSHVYFYSVSRFLWRRITAKQTCYTSLLFLIDNSEIKSNVKLFALYETLQNTKHTRLQSATTKKDTHNDKTQILRV